MSRELILAHLGRGGDKNGKENEKQGGKVKREEGFGGGRFEKGNK